MPAMSATSDRTVPATAPTPTADALVRLGRGRDADAWRELVERHGAAMYRAAFAVVRDSHLAADACQEAFLQVRDGAGRFRPRGSDIEAAARGWLLRVAPSSALMLARGLRRRQRREHALVEDRMADPVEAPGEGDDRRVAAAVAAAVAE